MREGPHDRTELVDLLEVFLLGEAPSLTGQQLADEVGITYEAARRRWRSLGFSEVGRHVPAFTHADLEALRLTQRLLGIGLIRAEDESAHVRALGRSFARLAEWQMGLLAQVVDLDTMDLEELGQIMDEVTPAVESLQNYVWRRHTLSAASRMLLATEASGAADDDVRVGEPDAQEGDQEGDEERSTYAAGTVMGVGFADIVDFTRKSRELSGSGLAETMDHFEGRALEIISEHGGRIIKTIGDEVLFVADDPVATATIGLRLVEERLGDVRFPQLRLGLAWGPALARLGDVLGPVVNIAARLTSTVRPGQVLVDRALAEQLRDDERFALRRLRRTSVRGYRRLEPWLLRRPAGEDPEITQEGEPGPLSAIIHQQARDFRRAVDEIEARLERSPGGEGPEKRPDR